jgi:hypothetical protein
MSFETASLWNEEQTSPEAREALSNADLLHDALQLPTNASKEEWRSVLHRAFHTVPPPDQSTVKNPTETRMKFLQEQHTTIQKNELDTLTFIAALVEEKQRRGPSGPALEDIYTPLVLDKITDLIERKHVYEAMVREEKPSEMSTLPMYCAIFANMMAQSKIAGAMPLAASGDWSWPLLKRLDVRGQKALVSAERDLTEKLWRAGLHDVPDVGKLLLKGTAESQKMMGEIIEKATPASKFDVILLLYVLQTSDDKFGAALEFGSFMVANGMAEMALEAAASRIALLENLSTKHPVIMAAAALFIVFGIDKLIGFDNMVQGLESRTDPAFWDMAGNVADMMAPSALYGQSKELVHAGGQRLGIATIDPRLDQRQFIGQQIMMANYEKGQPLGRNYAHDLEQWDNMVEIAATQAEKSGNPLKARLYRLEKTERGPGGEKEWAARQAVEVHAMYEQLRGMEQSLNELLQQHHVITAANGFEKFDLAPLAALPQEEGDVGIRSVLQSDQYRKIEQGIAGLTTTEIEIIPAPGPTMVSRVKRKSGLSEEEAKKLEEEYKEIRELHERCIGMAKRLAKTVSMYTHLKVYNQSWVQKRREQGETLIPKVVQDGMISMIVQSSRRREVLDRSLYPGMTQEQYRKNLQDLYQFDQDSDPWPNPLFDPLGWVKRCSKGRENRKDELYTDIETQTYFPEFLKDVQAMTEHSALEGKALLPLLEIIQNNKHDIPPWEAMRSVLLAIAETVPDAKIARGIRSLSSEQKPSQLVAQFKRELAQNDVSGKSLLLEKTLGAFCQEGLRSSVTNMRRQFLITSEYRVFYDRKQSQWMVEWNGHARSVGKFEYQGLNISRGKVEYDSPSRRIPYLEWCRNHPECEKAVTQDLQWCKEWIRYMEATISEAQEAEQQREGNKQVEHWEKEKAAEELAKAHPCVWQKYPLADSGRRYDHVAYVPKREDQPARYLYLQMPEVETGSSISSSDFAIVNGNNSTTRMAVYEEGKREGEVYTVKGNYRRSLDSDPNGSVISEGLGFPIEGDPLGSIRKVLAPFVSDINAAEVRATEQKALEYYNALPSDASDHSLPRHEQFLRLLEGECSRLSRIEDKPEQYRSLTQAQFDEVLEKARKLAMM